MYRINKFKNGGFYKSTSGKSSNTLDSSNSYTTLVKEMEDSGINPDVLNTLTDDEYREFQDVYRQYGKDFAIYHLERLGKLTPEYKRFNYSKFYGK